MVIDELDLDGPLEIETTLVVTSNDPISVQNRISQLSDLAGFRLNKSDDQELRDVYFDSYNGSLSAKRIAIRLRETDGQSVIGLKGQPRTGQLGSIERVEIELDWTLNAWDKILELLSRVGVQIPRYPVRFDPTHPIDTFTNSDFMILQERSISRKVRNIDSIPTGGSRLSEMVIDDVSYRVDETTIHHYEIEVEIKSEEGQTSVVGVVNELMSEFGSDLRHWFHSKLSTGQAIVELISNGRLRPFVGIGNSLKPKAYDLIDEYLLSIEGYQHRDTLS